MHSETDSPFQLLSQISSLRFPAWGKTTPLLGKQPGERHRRILRARGLRARCVSQKKKSREKFKKHQNTPTSAELCGQVCGGQPSPGGARRCRLREPCPQGPRGDPARLPEHPPARCAPGPAPGPLEGNSDLSQASSPGAARDARGMLRCPQGKYRGTFSFLEVIKAFGRFSGGRGGTFVLAARAARMLVGWRGLEPSLQQSRELRAQVSRLLSSAD